MSDSQQLKRISDKLQELLKKYESVKKENEKLKAELLPSKERELKLLEQIEGLEQKVMVLKTSTGQLDELDKKELDKKLNSYLKEIDRCIAMLGDN